jgi:hypothetical protein
MDDAPRRPDLAAGMQEPPRKVSVIARETRVLVISTVVLMLAASYLPIRVVVKGSGEAMAPSAVALVVLAVSAVGAFAIAESVGYSVRPLDPATGPEDWARTARWRWFERLGVRIIASSAVAIVAFALAFVSADGGGVLLPLGIGATCVLLAVEGLPTRRAVERIASGLEADGARSGLREAFGL